MEYALRSINKNYDYQQLNISNDFSLDEYFEISNDDTFLLKNLLLKLKFYFENSFDENLLLLVSIFIPLILC
jgi:hypothetical protein